MSRSGRPKRPARPGPRPDPRRGAVRPVPLERGRAIGILAGLFVFAAGFAVAAIDLLLVGGTRTPYLIAIGIGFFGLGVVGFFLNRGTVPRPEAAIWSPTGFRALAGPVGLPAVPVMAGWYLLVAVGVIGNFVIPMFFDR